MQRTRNLVCFAAITALMITSNASASIVVGGSTLLTQADADQLESWLGEGPITITRLFAKQPGDDSLDFHAAVDGKGRTFSVLQVLADRAQDLTTGLMNNPPQVIGGYNPQSWSSTSSFNRTPADADRTAFLFNLTTDEIQRQSLSSELGNGELQTFNYAAYGPTFGGGHDIWVNTNLTGGHTLNKSYGGTDRSNDILSGGSYIHTGGGMFGAIEVFTIATADIAAAPEPVSLLVWGGLAAASVVVARRTRRRFAIGARST